MSKHLHKRFSGKEVTEIFERYLSKEIGVEQGLALLKVKRRRFFDLLKVYRKRPDDFTLTYKRKTSNHKIDDREDKAILKELEKEKKIIDDKKNPVKFYNYSYLKNILEEKHKIKVSVSTVIRRAKKMGFTKKRFSEKPMTGRF